MSENNGVTNGAAMGVANTSASSSMVPSDAQLRSVFESLDEGLVVADSEGRILHWNSASLEMHGFPDSPEGKLMLNEFTRIFELSTLDGRVLSLDDDRRLFLPCGI
jgi:PAS domain-containing protein